MDSQMIWSSPPFACDWALRCSPCWYWSEYNLRQFKIQVISTCIYFLETFINRNSWNLLTHWIIFYSKCCSPYMEKMQKQDSPHTYLLTWLPPHIPTKITPPHMKAGGHRNNSWPFQCHSPNFSQWGVYKVKLIYPLTMAQVEGQGSRSPSGDTDPRQWRSKWSGTKIRHICLPPSPMHKMDSSPELLPNTLDDALSMHFSCSYKSMIRMRRSPQSRRA